MRIYRQAGMGNFPASGSWQPTAIERLSCCDVLNLAIRDNQGVVRLRQIKPKTFEKSRFQASISKCEELCWRKFASRYGCAPPETQSIFIGAQYVQKVLCVGLFCFILLAGKWPKNGVLACCRVTSFLLTAVEKSLYLQCTLRNQVWRIPSSACVPARDPGRTQEKGTQGAGEQTERQS